MRAKTLARTRARHRDVRSQPELPMSWDPRKQRERAVRDRRVLRDPGAHAAGPRVVDQRVRVHGDRPGRSDLEPPRRARRLGGLHRGLRRCGCGSTAASACRGSSCGSPPRRWCSASRATRSGHRSGWAARPGPAARSRWCWPRGGSGIAAGRAASARNSMRCAASPSRRILWTRRATAARSVMLRKRDMSSEIRTCATALKVLGSGRETRRRAPLDCGTPGCRASQSRADAARRTDVTRIVVSSCHGTL